jgi:hypothetical protein
MNPDGYVSRGAPASDAPHQRQIADQDRKVTNFSVSLMHVRRSNARWFKKHRPNFWPQYGVHRDAHSGALRFGFATVLQLSATNAA